MCAENSVLSAFESHVALFFTSEACGAIPVISGVWQVVVVAVMNGWSGHTCLWVCVCGSIHSIIVSPWFIMTCCTSCIHRNCSLEY